VADSWKLQFISYFMEATHEPLHLRQMKSDWVKFYGHTLLFELLFSLKKLLNMGMMRNFDIMLTETLNCSVEFCNFVQWHVYVNYGIKIVIIKFDTTLSQLTW
jgi:hypothetical protein